MSKLGLMRTSTLFFWCLFSIPVLAVQPPDELSPAEDQAPEWQQRLLTERRVSEQLAELSAAVDRRDLAEFDRQLQVLREVQGSLMVPVLNEGYQPLSAALFQRLQNLDVELRRIVNTEDASAAGELQRVLQSGGAEELPALLHRYSGTTTSQRIHLLLAVLHADRGQHLAARGWLRPLLSPATAPDILRLANQLLSRLPVDAGAAEQSEVPTAKSVPAAAGGQAAAAALPRFLQWLELLPLSVGVRRAHQDSIARLTDAQRGGERGLPWISSEPQLDADRIYVKQPDRITAWERATGRHLWSRSLNPRAAAGRENQQSAMQSRSGSDLLERHEFLGRVSADAQRLYLVYGVSDGSGMRSVEESLQLRMRLTRSRMEGSAELWELIAIEKSTGRRLWTAGGEAVEGRFRNELSQAWFFGPPIVSEGRLYQVFERDGLISAGCLDASNGQLLWSVPLVTPEFPIQQDVRRQLLSARGIVHKGLLITSTTAGWVFGVDLLTRSVIWAQQLPEVTEGQMRGFPQARRLGGLQAPQPLTGVRVQRSQDPLLTGESVFWMLAETPAPVVVHALSGRLEKTASLDGTVCVYRDSGLVVLASPIKTSAYTLPQMQVLWQQQRAAGSALPVGPGAVSNGRLLIPLSDGSVQVLNLQDGSVVESVAGLRAGRTSGGLYGDATGIVSFGLDHISALGPERREIGGPEDWLQRAQFLLETGQPAACLAVLADAAPATMELERVRRMRFRATAAVYAADPEQNRPLLQQLRELAPAGSSQALAWYLTLGALRPGQEDAVEQFSQALQLGESLLEQEVPTLQAVLNAAKSGEDNLLAGRNLAGLESWRTPLRSWLCQRLDELLNYGTDLQRQQVRDRLSGYSDEVLLRLTGAVASAEALSRADRRVSAGELNEVTVQLLLQAVVPDPRLETAAADGTVVASLQQRRQQALQLLDRLRQLAEQLPRGGRRRLTEQLLSWIRQQAGAAADSERLAAISAERDRHWREVAESPWKLIPVSTTGGMMPRVTLSTILRRQGVDDPVLQGIEWRLRRESDEILGEAAHELGGEAWRVRPRSSDARQAMMLTEESITRAGTVLIHRSREAITAFSIVDGRLLWTKAMTGDAEMLLLLDRTFEKFNFDQNWQLLYERSRQICGQSSRWICLLGDARLEMLDLLTGELMWSLASAGMSRQVFAAEQAVLLRDPQSGREVQLEPFSGIPRRRTATKQPLTADQPLRLPFRVRAAGLSGKIIRATGNELVAWDPEASLDDQSTLQWLDAGTLDVVRTVELTGLVRAQFLGRELLAVLRQTPEIQLVNLETGAQQVLSYSTEDSKPLNLERVELAADAGNVYLFEVPARQNGLIQPQMMLGLRGDAIRGELMAISRSTGQLAWKTTIPEDTLATFDGSDGAGLLLTSLRMAQRAANANNIPGLNFPGDTQFLVTALARSSGRQLLNYTVVSQFPGPGLRFGRTPEGGFELEAFGNRARLIRQTPAEK